MSKRPDLTSALPPLFPEAVIDVMTGELVEQSEFDDSLAQLASFVQQESQRLWNENKKELKETLSKITATSPAEVGRQAKLHVNLERLPREVKVKSRIERLTRYQTITSAKSYFSSPIKTKQEPSFSPYLNLGAVDNSMASLVLFDGKIELTFKCWDKEFLLIFKVPEYVLARNIAKISLPTIQPFGESWGFIFSAKEIKTPATINPEYLIGVDLGRVEPYTLVVIHAKSGSRVAQYTASPRLRVLTAKRDRLNKELRYLYTKSKAHEALGFRKEALEQERILTRAKRNRLINKITWLIATEIHKVAVRFSPRFVAIEDLSWVNTTHGMSRWTHAKDQAAITHKLTRSGMVTKKVSPKNTSQECHKCGLQIAHNPSKRLVVCSGCSLTVDRDINAAINIAFRPLRKRSKGNNCTDNSEVIATSRSNKILLTRNKS